MRGRTRTDWWGVVIDAPDAVALANFYVSVLSWPIVKEEDDHPFCPYLDRGGLG
jgi:hypothetical protein